MQTFNLAIAKVKHLRTWNFPPKCPPSKSSSSGKDFENRLNIFGDTGFLVSQCTGWKWQLSNVVDGQSFQLVIAKIIYLRTWIFPTKCTPSTSSSWCKDFENRLITFGDIGFLLAQCTGWKWQTFKCCRYASFYLAIAKVKYLGTWNFSTQMPPPPCKSFELRQRFRKSVEYPWRYRIFSWHSVQVESGKLSNVVDAQSSHLAFAKVKYLRTWNFPPKYPPPPQTLRADPKISKIGWIPLEIWHFSWHSVQVESGKLSNLVDTQSFHLAIAKVKYLRTWNFTPKCPPIEVSRWGKDFENRLKYLGRYWIFLAQFTGWKWQTFKCCRCANF